MSNMGGWQTTANESAVVAPSTHSRARIWAEIWILLALSLGKSGVYSIVNIIGRLTAEAPLADQVATLNPSQSPRPYLDLTYQLLGIVFALVPVALALFFLAHRDGPGEPRDRGPRAIGLDWGEKGAPWLSDIKWGLIIFAGISIPALAFYLFGRTIGITVQVQPSALADYWWRVPVLILSAFENGALEEILVVGYLYERTKDLGWQPNTGWRFLAFSAILRGSYHLYQGIGPFFGNVAMGLIFAMWYRSRWGRRRVIPLIVTHTLIDVVAFVGYALLPVAWAARLGFA